MVKKLGESSRVRRVLLFGSWARGDADERSNINLAVEPRGLDDQSWLNMLELAENATTLFDIHLVRTDTISLSVLESITREGIVLYDRRSQPQ